MSPIVFFFTVSIRGYSKCRPCTDVLTLVSTDKIVCVFTTVTLYTFGNGFTGFGRHSQSIRCYYDILFVRVLSNIPVSK